MIVIDVSDPSNPQQIGSIEDGASDGEVVIKGEHAFLVSSGCWHGWCILRASIISLADPSNPVQVGEWSRDGTEYLGHGIDVRGDHLYLGGLRILDISNPTAPVLKGAVDLDGFFANGLAVAGDFAYVADGEIGVHVVDIADPSAPTIVGTIETSGSAGEVACDNRHAHVADGSGGLQIALLQCETPEAARDATGVLGLKSDIPSAARPLSVHPNPFNPQATIAFGLAQAGHVEVAVFDLTGRRVAVLTRASLAAGPHRLTWNGRDGHGHTMPSGSYIVRLETTSRVEAKKVMLIR
jgi:hypothetical protein